MSTLNTFIEKIKSVFSSGPKTAAAIFAVIVIWMTLGFIFSDDETKQHNSLTTQKNNITSVQVRNLQAEAVSREISLLGNTRYSRKIIIKALTEGTVVSIRAQEGALILKGTSIIQLDDRESKALFNHAFSLAEQKAMEYQGAQKLFDEGLLSSAKLAAAKSDWENTKAQKIQKQINFESTAVKAPFEGILQKVFVEEGDYIRAGDQLAEVLDFSPFIVEGEISEKEASYIVKGMPADARLLNGEIHHGNITYMSTKGDENSRSFKLELEIPNTKNEPVLSGISSTITIPVTHKQAYQIATSTLEINEQGKFGVKVIDDDNIVAFVPVEIIKSTNKGLWVTGLAENTKLITRGQGFVNEGDIVSPVYESNLSVQQNENAELSTKMSANAAPE